jgi:hypothetical protein
MEVLETVCWNVLLSGTKLVKSGETASGSAGEQPDKG